MGRPRKYPRFPTCEGCGVVFENLTGQPRRFHSVGCAANHRPVQQSEFVVPRAGTPERAQFDAWQAEMQRATEALARG